MAQRGDAGWSARRITSFTIAARRGISAATAASSSRSGIGYTGRCTFRRVNPSNSSWAWATAAKGATTIWERCTCCRLSPPAAKSRTPCGERSAASLFANRVSGLRWCRRHAHGRLNTVCDHVRGNDLAAGLCGRGRTHDRHAQLERHDHRMWNRQAIVHCELQTLEVALATRNCHLAILAALLEGRDEAIVRGAAGFAFLRLRKNGGNA